MPPKLKLLVVEPYYRKIDPREHMETYFMSMQLHGVSDRILYRAFPTTLKGIARE